MDEKTKLGHGGARPGSGRKKEDRIKTSNTLARTTIEKLRFESRTRGIPVGRVIDELVATLDD